MALLTPSLAEPRLLTGREGLVQRNTSFAAYSADFRKPVTSRNTPTRIYLLLKIQQYREFSGEVYIITQTLFEIFSWQLSPHRSLYCTPTIYVYVYSRQRTHTYSFIGSRIRDSAAAVHEAAATLGFTLKKEQEKVTVAFTQGHDVFAALPTCFGNSLCYCCLPHVFDKHRGFTNGSIAMVASPLKKDQVAHCTSIASLARPSLLA